MRTKTLKKNKIELLKSEKNKNSCNVANAKILGSELAKSAAEKGVKDVYLDRGSNKHL